MKIEDIKFSDDRASFIISDIELYHINALRRTLLVDVPKMAIDKVEVHLGSISDEDGRTYESTTPLFDEIIVHRLGLVPIPTDLDLLIFQKDCTCDGDGCSGCQIMFSLNKRGSGTVYSGDLEPLGDSKLAPKDKKIPIVRLTEDQGILIYATAVLGTGKQHAKWQATHGVGYKPIPKITIDGKGCGNPEEVAEGCPNHVYDISTKKLVAKRPEDCSLCRTCEVVCDTGAITVDPETSRYFFKFETDGSVDPKTALLYALGALESKFTDITKDIAKLK